MGGLRMFSFALLIAVPASAGSPCDIAAPVPAPGSPCDTVPEKREFVAHYPGGETTCALGGAYAFFTRPGTINKLVVEFEGGGGCWNAISCSMPYFGFNWLDKDGNDIFGTKVFFKADVQVPPTLQRLNNPELLVGENGELRNLFLSTTDSRNPYRDWHHLYVPYCTGDAHTGDNVKEYDSKTKINHKGRVNAKAALDWALHNMMSTAPDMVATIGCSAGSIAGKVFVPQVITNYPKAQHYYVGDSYIGYVSPEMWTSMRDAWDFLGAVDNSVVDTAAMHDYNDGIITNNLVHATAAHFAKNRLFFVDISSTQDKVQTAMFRGGGGDIATWSGEMRKLVAENNLKTSNYAAFIGQGNTHCDYFGEHFGNNTLKASDEMYITASDWMIQVLNSGGVGVKEKTCSYEPWTETAPHSLRKYDAKEAALVQQAATTKTESSMVPAWALPLFGVVAMCSFAAFVSVRARSDRYTRQSPIAQPVRLDEEAFLSDLSEVGVVE